MPRLRRRDQETSGKDTHEYQEERKLIELGICRVVTDGDPEGVARALSAVIYGKPLRLLTDWSYLFTRVLGVHVELLHDDVLEGEYLSYREAWQIAYNTSAKVRARVVYLDGIAGNLPSPQGHTASSTGEVQPSDSTGHDNTASNSGRN